MNAKVPRLLPLIAIAAGGVVAVKALASVDAVPQALAGARAWAAEAAEAATGKEDAEAPVLPPETPTTAEVKPIAACAPSAAELAKDAGLSPAELQLLQSLAQRRGQLDDREAELDTNLQLLAAAEAKLDAKLQALSGLKGEIQTLIGQLDDKEAAEVQRLVTVYSKMRPRDAAPIMTQLNDKVRLPVAAQMKETALAAIMAQMPPAEAKKLTESLAERFEAARAQAKSMSASAAPAAPAADTAQAAAPAAKPAG